MRWRKVVDLDVALSAVEDVLSRWWTMRQWPDAQPFSGGVLDAWPARMTDGLAICRVEWKAITEALMAEAEQTAQSKKGVK